MGADVTDIVDEAIAWHVRLAEANDDTWAEFIAWLEADPTHAAVYDQVAADDRVIVGARFGDVAPVADNDNSPWRRGWLWLAGGTTAAAALAVVIAPGILKPRQTNYEIATQAGERRAVTLSDGTKIELSGGTRVRLDSSNPRVATLDRGEALFTVRHDSAHPFTLTAAGVAIRDLGTVFNVAHDNGRLSVAVSEGSVMFQPDGARLTLIAGDAVSVLDGGRRAIRSRIAPDLVGSWRTGVLTFEGDTLADVTVTIRRLYATDITLEGGLSQQPFTGMVRLSGSAERDVPHLAELIGATWRRDGEKWILAGGAGATR